MISHHRLKLEPPNSDKRCKTPWLSSLLFWRSIDHDLQVQIFNLKVPNSHTNYTTSPDSHTIWVRSRNCGCLVTWFCYQLIAKPGNKTAAALWPGTHFTNDFSITIQIRSKIHLALIQLQLIISQQNLAHATTAQLSCHVPNFVAITLLVLGWEQNEISITFELWWKNC